MLSLGWRRTLPGCVVHSRAVHQSHEWNNNSQLKKVPKPKDYALDLYKQAKGHYDEFTGMPRIEAAQRKVFIVQVRSEMQILTTICKPRKISTITTSLSAISDRRAEQEGPYQTGAAETASATAGPESFPADVQETRLKLSEHHAADRGTEPEGVGRTRAVRYGGGTRAGAIRRPHVGCPGELRIGTEPDDALQELFLDLLDCLRRTDLLRVPLQVPHADGGVQGDAEDSGNQRGT